MCARLPGRVATFEAGPAWIVAGRGKIAFSAGDCLASEGFVALDASESLAARLERQRQHPDPLALFPDGHCALALARTGSGELHLLRGLSGGERLYYCRLGELVLFAASVLPLLAHPLLRPSANRAKIAEAVLSGLTLFGNDTLFAGIQEVLPGCRLSVREGVMRHEWHWKGLLEPRRGERASLAREYRNALGEAVHVAIGKQRPVATTLSGGIDSAAVTALAVDAVGADNVEVFTYEFDDPAHSCETRYAVEVCKRLGVRRHHVFKISLAEFLNAIPETVWRGEHFVHWSKAWMLPVARHIRDAGHSRFLCGFGVGSHMSYFADLAWALGRHRAVRRLLGGWGLARRRRWRWLRHLERIHPALEPPNLRLLCFLLGHLRRSGLVENASDFYPQVMAALVDDGFDAARPSNREPPAGLLESIREESFMHLCSCVDVTRWEKPLREIGTTRI